MGKRDGEFIIILDIDKVFSADDMNMIQGGGQPMMLPGQDVGLEMQMAM
jgi:hypothetical protein